MGSHAHLPIGRRRRVTAAAIAAFGTVAPLAVIGGAATAHANTGVPVNGPLVIAGGGLTAVNADGSGQQPVPMANVCGPSGGFVASSLTYSPDGWRAAVYCGTTIVVTSADLTQVAARYDDPSLASTDDPPVWSYNGGALYFANTVPAQGGAPATVAAWSVRADGTGAAPVPNAPFNERVVSAAPNGDLLFLAPAQGVVSKLAFGAAQATPLSGINSSGYVWAAQLSPNGSRIAAIVTPTGTPAGGRYLYVYNADGSGATQVAEIADQTTKVLQGDNLIWSPDSGEVAYTVSVSSQPGVWHDQVWAVPAQAGATPSLVIDQGPVAAWHNGPLPTGTRPTPRNNVTRLAGGDRISTSVAVADAAYNQSRAGAAKADVAVISRSDNYADALPGNALAAEKHGPLMLTGSAKLDPTVGAELQKVLAPGSTVYVLGGVNALSPQIEADIRALGLTPRRLSGPDRYATSVAIAGEISAHPGTVLVATGNNYPDALAAGAAAANDPNGGVVILSNDGVLAPAVRDYVAGIDGSQHTFGVGRQAVAALNGSTAAGHFTDLSGVDRYATDLAVANNPTLFPAAPANVGIATGLNWPDALSGGAFIGAHHGPLLLTGSPANATGAEANDGVNRWLSGHTLSLTSMFVFGGTAVVPEAVVRDAADNAFGPGNWTEH